MPKKCPMSIISKEKPRFNLGYFLTGGKMGSDLNNIFIYYFCPFSAIFGLNHRFNYDILSAVFHTFYFFNAQNAQTFSVHFPRIEDNDILYI